MMSREQHQRADIRLCVIWRAHLQSRHRFLATSPPWLSHFPLLTNRIRRVNVQMTCPSGRKLKTGRVGFFNLIALLIQMFVSQKLDNKPKVFLFFIWFFLFLPPWATYTVCFGAVMSFQLAHLFFAAALPELKSSPDVSRCSDVLQFKP